MPTTKKTTYAKIDPNTIEITEEVTTVETIVSTYLMDDLIAARDQQVVSKQSMILNKDAEIAKADILINQAASLGIVPIAPIIAP